LPHTIEEAVQIIAGWESGHTETLGIMADNPLQIYNELFKLNPRPSASIIMVRPGEFTITRHLSKPSNPLPLRNQIS